MLASTHLEAQTVRTTPITALPSAAMSTLSRWAAAGAAQRGSVGRAITQRVLGAGRSPGPAQPGIDWHRPVEDLLAAGFRTGCPTNPVSAGTNGRSGAGHGRDDGHAPKPHHRYTTEPEADLTRQHPRGSLEVVHRQDGQQPATDHAVRLERLWVALRMLNVAVGSARSAAVAPRRTSTRRAPSPLATPGPSPSAPDLVPGWSR